MQLQYNPYALILVLAAALAGGLVLLAWQRRKVPGGWPIVFLMLAVAEWSLGYALELASANLGAQVFWANLQYIGIVSVPVLWLVFALEYTGLEKWLTRRNLVLLAAVPALSLLGVWTNDSHGLIWSQIAQETVGSSVVLDLTYGPLFWLHLGYAYLLLLTGTARFLQVLIRSPQLYRGQAGALLVAALAPWIGNGLYVSGLNPLPNLDLTPLAFTVTGAALSWAIYRFRLLDFVPIAREAIIRGMGDGVIVLDGHNRIVELNPAAEKLIGRLSTHIVGGFAERVLPGKLGDSALYATTTELRTEMTPSEGHSQRTYDLLVSPLQDRRGRVIGRLLLAHDVTDRIQAERALRRRAVQLRTASEVAREAATELDLTRLLERTVRLISERFGYYHAGIFMIDATREWAVLQAASSEGGQHMLERLHRLRRGVGIVGHVVAEGDGRVALDVGEDAVFFDNPDLPETRSEMALPLRAHGEIIGALDVQSKEPGAFDEEDVAVMQTLADQIAVAISNARLFHQARESLEAERRAYGEIGRQAWSELLGSEGDLGYVRDSHGTALHRDTLGGEARSALTTGSVTPSKDNAANVAVPIKSHGKVIGVIDAHKRIGSAPWTPDQISLLQTLSEQLSLALESARLYQTTQRRAAEDRLVSDITARMRETLDVDTVLQTAVKEMGQALGISKVEVRLGPGSGPMETESQEEVEASAQTLLKEHGHAE